MSASVIDVREQWGVPDIAVGAPVINIFWAYLGSLADGRRVTEPLYAALSPRVEMPEEMSYLRLQGLADLSQRHGLRRYWKGSFAPILSDAGLEAFVARGSAPGDPAPLWAGELVALGGAIARVGEDDTAYSGRDASFDFLSLSSWEDPAEDEVRLAGARHYWDTMSPFISPRAYVNSLEDEGSARVRDAYGENKYDRLAALKRRYDPDNVFHRNQNIRP